MFEPCRGCFWRFEGKGQGEVHTRFPVGQATDRGEIERFCAVCPEAFDQSFLVVSGDVQQKMSGGKTKHQSPLLVWEKVIFFVARKKDVEGFVFGGVHQFAMGTPFQFFSDIPCEDRFVLCVNPKVSMMSEDGERGVAVERDLDFVMIFDGNGAMSPCPGLMGWGVVNDNETVFRVFGSAVVQEGEVAFGQGLWWQRVPCCSDHLGLQRSGC